MGAAGGAEPEPEPEPEGAAAVPSHDCRSAHSRAPRRSPSTPHALHPRQSRQPSPALHPRRMNSSLAAPTWRTPSQSSSPSLSPKGRTRSHLQPPNIPIFPRLHTADQSQVESELLKGQAREPWAIESWASLTYRSHPRTVNVPLLCRLGLHAHEELRQSVDGLAVPFARGSVEADCVRRLVQRHEREVL